MIDTHCHLTDKRFGTGEEVGSVIERAREAGVDRMITMGTSLEDSKKAVELAHKFEEVWCTVGIHPESVSGEDVIGQIVKLASLIPDKKVVAIGEIGLDRYRIEHSFSEQDWELQQTVFRNQLSLAVKHNLPVVIHNRETDRETLQIIDEFKGKITGVFHCFAQDEKFLREILTRGFYVGFAGNVTFEKNQALRRVAALVPNVRMLVETDAPYLAPEPVRGIKYNEPLNVRITAGLLAGLHHESMEKFEQILNENAIRLFSKMQNRQT